MSYHVHTHCDELGIFSIPADPSEKMRYERIQPKLEKFKSIVGGWIEVVRTEFLPELPCGCRIVMVVNEEGHVHNLPLNPRVQMYYPFGPIAGDAFLVGEGLVNTPGGEEEIDFFSLPTGFNTWEGPGSPLRFRGHNLVTD